MTLSEAERKEIKKKNGVQAKEDGKEGDDAEERTKEDRAEEERTS